MATVPKDQPTLNTKDAAFKFNRLLSNNTIRQFNGVGMISINPHV